MTSTEVEEIRNKISSWLTAEELLKEQIQDENLYFHFAAEFPAHSGRHCSIIQPLNRQDMIVVFSRIRLADTHRAALAALPAKEKEHFLWQMRYDLLFCQSSFEMEQADGELQSMRFSREIYYDGLTKNKLMEAIRENFKCELYVVWKFQEVFGEGGSSERRGPPEPMYC